MPGVDREALRAQTQQAAQQAQEGVRQTQATPTMAQRAAATAARTHAAAASGQPAQASAAPADPSAPAKPRTMRERLEALQRTDEHGFPVVFRGEEMNVPIEDAQRFIQKGMLADDLDRQRNEVRADKQGFAAFQQFQEWVSKDPARVRAVQDLYLGRLDPNRFYAQDGGDDDDSTTTSRPSAGQTSQVDNGLASRLEMLEQRLQQMGQAGERQTFERQLEEALARNKYLGVNPNRVEAARDIIRGKIAGGEFTSIDSEVLAAANKLQRMTSEGMDEIRERRDQQAEEFIPQPRVRGPSLPKLPDTLGHGTKDMRTRGHRDAVRGWLESAMRSMHSGH